MLMPHYYIYYDRSAEYGGDSIKWYDRDGREGAKEVAQKGDEGASEHGDRKEIAVIIGTKQKKGYVGSGETNEGYWTAIGCDDGGEETCSEEKQIACTTKIYAEIGGVVVAKKNGIEGFDEKKGEDESEDAEGGEDWHLLKGNSVEVAHAPNEKTLYVLNGCEEVEEGYD